MINLFLAFSDSAKFALIAKNLINGFGYGNSFNFWSSGLFNLGKTAVFIDRTTPPIMPISIAGFFKLFGINDFAVVATSFFYFILTLVFTYLLANKVFKNKIAGSLSALAVGLNYDIIHYAVSGASESPFMFEIVAAAYFASMKKKWASVVCLVLLILMYFTRPMAFIYIAGIILYWLLNNFKTKKAVIAFGVILIVGLLVDRTVLSKLSGQMFLYSVTVRGSITAAAQASSSVTSDALRGSVSSPTDNHALQIAKNIFYNLYNFYKLLPQIMSPYLAAVFFLGLFVKTKNGVRNSFNISVMFMFIVTLLVVAASIPFFRYIHPVVPLLYIAAIGSLCEILSLSLKSSKFVIISGLLLVMLFGAGQTLGVLLLDSRFEKNTHNVGKPPVYAELSYILKDNTNANEIVVTNLDTWGSWYGERRTVWFPLEPKMLIDAKTGQIPFDAIYLTSYKMDDDNYYMGKDWRMIFENPNDSSKWTCDGCSEIAKEFKLKDVYKVNASDDYEREDATAILLIRK